MSRGLGTSAAAMRLIPSANAFQHRARWLALLLAAGCASTPPSPPQTAAESQTPQAATKSQTPQAIAVAPAATAAPAPRAATASGGAALASKPAVVASAGALAAFPAGAQYVCVSGGNGSERRQTAIEFTPQVANLCRRHPEMGPCQYQREVCRRSGGRVFAADGLEITPAVEAEYDKRVTRIRMRGD